MFLKCLSCSFFFLRKRNIFRISFSLFNLKKKINHISCLLALLWQFLWSLWTLPSARPECRAPVRCGSGYCRTELLFKCLNLPMRSPPTHTPPPTHLHQLSPHCVPVYGATQWASLINRGAQGSFSLPGPWATYSWAAFADWKPHSESRLWFAITELQGKGFNLFPFFYLHFLSTVISPLSLCNGHTSRANSTATVFN